MGGKKRKSFSPQSSVTAVPLMFTVVKLVFITTLRIYVCMILKNFNDVILGSNI